MHNLITYSTAPTGWTTGNCTFVADGSITGPAGESVMKLTEDSNNAAHLVYGPASTYVQSRIYTFAVCVRKGATGRDWIVLAHNGGGTNRAWFNISTGALGSVDSTVISRGIRPLGNGWYLIWTTYLQNSANQPIIYPATADGVVGYLGDGASHVHITRAQITESTGPATYAQTVGKVVKGRTRRQLPRQNLMLWSEDVTNAAYFKESAAVTLTANAAAAPDGSVTADRVQWTSGSLRYVGQTITFAARVHTVSVWVRSVSGTSKFRLRLPSAVGLTNTDSADFTATTTWQRFSLTVSNSVSGSSSILIESDTTNAAGDIYVWGFQLSHSSGLCEYVQTTTTTIDEGAPRALMAPVNMVLDSEDLTTANWNPIGSVVRTLQPGQGLGGSTSTRLDDQSAAEYRGAYQPIAIPRDGRAYTVSVDVAKTSTTPSFGLNISLLGGTVVSMTPRIRPSDGAASQLWFSYGAWSYVEDLGTHWRLHSTITNNGTNNSLQVNVYAATGSSHTVDSVAGTGYADVGRVSITASKGPVTYVQNTTTVATSLGNARGRRLQQNLLQISNLNNAAWNVGNATRTTGPVAPGGRTGIKLTEDSSNGAHYIDQTVVPALLPGRRYTVSVKAKLGSAGRPWAVIGANGGGVSGWLNLSDGTIQNPSTSCQTRARQLSDGWWQIWFSFPADATPVIRFYLAATYGAAVYVGDGTSFGYYADAQLTETDGEADFAESTRAVQGAVNEGLGGIRKFVGRQNAVTKPSAFSDATAWALSNATIVSNATTAPDGSLTASRLVDNGVNALHYVTQSIFDPIAPLGGSYRPGFRTWSVYAKADGRSGLVFAVDSTNQGAYFDLALGLVTVPFTVAGGFAECRPVGNGWYRCSITCNTSVTGSLSPLIGISSDPYAPIGAYVGSGTGIYIWGAQASAGASEVEFVDTLTTTQGFPRGGVF